MSTSTQFCWECKPPTPTLTLLLTRNGYTTAVYIWPHIISMFKVSHSYQLPHIWGNTTELDYSWNRNTAVLLYNQLPDHGKQKCLGHMINPYYNPLWCYFKKQLVVSNLLSILSNWLRLVPDWFRPVLQLTYCLIIAQKKCFACANQF